MSKKSKRALRKKIVEFVEKYEIYWYVFAVLLSIFAIPASIIAFPSVEMATFVVASLTGVVSSLAALASALVSSNDDQENPEDEAGVDNSTQD